MFQSARKPLCPMLAVVMVFYPVAAAAGQPAASSDQAAETAGKVELSYVTPAAFLGALAHPERVLTAPNMQALPIEVISAAGKQELGIDPVDIESLLAIVEPPGALPVPGLGVVVRFSKPHKLANILSPLKEGTAQDELDGRPYHRATQPMRMSLYMPDDRTLIVGTETTLRGMLNNAENPVEGPLLKRLRESPGQHDLRVSLVLGPVRALLNAQLAQVPLPVEFEDLKKVPDLLQGVDITLNLSQEMQFGLTLFAQDEQAAVELEQIILQSIQAAREKILAEMEKEQSDDPVEQAGVQYVRRMIDTWVTAFRPVRDKERLELTAHGESTMQMGTIAVLTALLLPAVQQAREAARRTASRNNLRRIALAMHNYHVAHQSFPARANFDDEGKPLLSWRVHLLPFLDEQALYNEFRLDEPWDSEHNKQLIPRMPAVYRNPNSPADDDTTNYLVPVGEGTLFQGTGTTRMRDVRDGTSNTIMLVEANADRAVIWTKPDDSKYDPQQPMNGLGGFRPDGFLAVFADGSVRLIANEIDQEVLRKLFTKAGGEPLGEF